MGAIQQSNAIYLTIGNGQICKKVMKPTPLSKERVNKKGATVHEEYYKGWKGKITGIAVRDHAEYGKFWNVTLTDDDGDAILQMNYSSGYSQAFLKILPNIDLTADVNIVPDQREVNGKKKTTLFITQHGQPVKWYYTKDDPKGLPELKSIKIKGKMTYDDSDILEFLEKMVNETIVPKLGKPKSPAAASKPSEVIEVEAEEIDDLPF